MASFVSTSPITVATLPSNNALRNTTCQLGSLSTIRGGPVFGGLRLAPKFNFTKSFPQVPGRSKTTISCSIISFWDFFFLQAQPETLQNVQNTIANQLSIEESAVTPSTKFVDLEADSRDTFEIMMTLEEKFGVSIGEGGAENISTVQDAADLIEKVKAASA
ncbi:hypothetical protein UlMin_012067 [Ulmus minor]